MASYPSIRTEGNISKISTQNHSKPLRVSNLELPPKNGVVSCPTLSLRKKCPSPAWVIWVSGGKSNKFMAIHFAITSLLAFVGAQANVQASTGSTGFTLRERCNAQFLALSVPNQLRSCSVCASVSNSKKIATIQVLIYVIYVCTVIPSFQSSLLKSNDFGACSNQGATWTTARTPAGHTP